MFQLTDVRIVSAETIDPIEDIGAAAAKSIPSHARYRYSQKLTYMLDNGQSLPGVVRALTRPKLQDALARKMRAVEQGELFASFRDGVYSGGIVQKFSLMMR